LSADALTVPDEATMLGSPVDLSKVDVDAYVIAGAADHLCPWQLCPRPLSSAASRSVASWCGSR